MADENELNRHNDPTGLVQSAQAAASGQYLGDHAVIDRLVRDFVSVVVDRFSKVAQGQLTPEEAAERDKALCQHMGRIVLGRELGFTPVDHWTDGALPMYVRNQLASSIQTNEDDEGVMAQVFALLAHSVSDQIRQSGADHASMVSEANTAIQSVTELLLGVEHAE